jgi:outer membrane protein OmpA-like peptidoglycan-associated protein
MNSSVDDTAIDDGLGETAPVWAVFGDLMSGVVGAFVLILIGVLLVQMDLVSSLQSEIAKRQQEEARRMALERALAIPLQSGRVTLNNGRIGISGSVLFDFNSDQLRPEGQQLLKSLVPPLEVYLGERDEMLMVSGFTDDKTVVKGPHQRFEDNLELSAQRALTVTRTLVKEGMPRASACSAPPSAPNSPWPATPMKRAERSTAAWKWPPCPAPRPRRARPRLRRLPPSHEHPRRS